MFRPNEPRGKRWLQRRLERQDRRRNGAPAPAQPLNVLAAATLVDGYCDLLGPACNDDFCGPMIRRPGPPLALVRP